MERMKLTKKEKEQILKSGAEAMSKIIERMSIEMGELEEENKKLKDDLDKREYYDKVNGLDKFVEMSNEMAELEKENKKLKEENEKLQEYKFMYEGLCK